MYLFIYEHVSVIFSKIACKNRDHCFRLQLVAVFSIIGVSLG